MFDKVNRGAALIGVLRILIEGTFLRVEFRVRHDPGERNFEIRFFGPDAELLTEGSGELLAAFEEVASHALRIEEKPTIRLHFQVLEATAALAGETELSGRSFGARVQRTVAGSTAG